MPGALPALDVPAELDPHAARPRTDRRNAMNALMQSAAGLARAERQGDPRPDGAARRRDDPGDDGAAAAAVRARPAVHLQHRDGADGDDGRGLHGPAARLRGLPGGDPADDAAAPLAQRRLDARRAARGPHRRRRRGQGDRVVRPLPDRRQLRGRPDRVRDPRRHQLRRRHQGRRADRRGRRALHARRDARQADGDRRRHERRPDRREGGQAAPRRGRRRGRVLRLDGRRLEVRARRRDGGPPDPVHQHHRRLRHRRRPARPDARRRRPTATSCSRSATRWSRRSRRC